MKNELKFLSEFKDLLKDYRVSDETRGLLKTVNLVLLASPTAVGRNTLITELLKTGGYHFIVSDTTRQPRSNNGVMEVSGNEYWFVSEGEFLDGLKRGSYLEAAVIHNQQVSGISLKELTRASAGDKVAITDIEVQGVKNVMAAKPDTHAIFLLPPSFDEWMKRLDGRGTMSVDEKRRRLTSAISEYSYALAADYFTFLIADTLSVTVENVSKIVKNQSLDPSAQLNARELVKELLAQTQQALEKM